MSNTPKKVLLTTIHCVPNAGSALQTYATERILQDLGCEVHVLNYIPPRCTYKRYLNDCFHNFKKLIFLPLFISNNIIYGSFLKRFCNLTKKYYSLQQIKKHCPQADLYVTGSDQVWNSIYNEGIDEFYYYSYLPENKNKIAFSASFGRSELPERELAVVAKFLSSYKYISVREKSAKLILEKLGFENVIQTLDPTLLLDRLKWKQYLIKNKRIIKEPYIFVYVPYNIDSIDEIRCMISYASQRFNIKTVAICKRNVLGVNKTIKFASPRTFINLMYYSNFIITNSFHGTAFSINFNKQFVVFKPKSFSTRVESLLSMCHLSNRLIIRAKDAPIEDRIDFSYSNAVLKKEREVAINFINKVIQ